MMSEKKKRSEAFPMATLGVNMHEKFDTEFTKAFTMRAHDMTMVKVMYINELESVKRYMYTF